MKLSNGIKLTLVISLVLNVFLIGYLAGGYARPFHKPMTHERIMLKELFKGIPAETREKLKPEIKQTKQQLKSNMRLIRESRQAIAGILETDPLDTLALKAEFKKIQDLSHENIAISQNSLYQAIQSLSVEERKALAQRMKQKDKWRNRR